MAALCNRAGHYIFALWLLLSFFYSIFFYFPRLFSAVAHWMSSIGLRPHMVWPCLSANLGCRSETWCRRLSENTGHKKSPNVCHLGTIAQLCRPISSQLRRVTTIGKKTVKQQYVLHMSPQYGELRRPTSGWDRFTSLGHPCKFQRLSHLGSVTARHSNSGHQPNFAALNRGRHLYSAGRPSRWALAHILVFNCLKLVRTHIVKIYHKVFFWNWNAQFV